MTEKNEKTPPHWRRRVGKGAYYTANIFLPLSELRYTATKIGPSVINHLKRARYLTPSYQLDKKLREPVLCFDDAVAASGISIEMLIKRFHRRKQLCLVLSAVPALLIVSVMLVILASNIYTPLLLAKTLALVLSLLSLAAIPFVQALTCSWRLWQLREHRVSHQERGGFKDFLAENHWFKTTLSLRQ
ncbi:Uncharacterised protein [Serratia entomophila]|uniref:TraX n=1 Tax=Serratia entomophila TaxID=42906 RepID=A7M7I1_9GAMM|nr:MULTISPECIES: conjugal transfer protein TraX [Serratia]ABU23822.1 TraX [Serratia entomophila]MDH2272295.1 conjugal transfer protein TraX [Serratia marcescens]MDH2279460.1 conjugal transfer protein TraX [Serratia marcescens]UIW20883.1 conjugal transfer protein TraX [Serratia entomophila]ULG10279.1 TraX [Serratia entomophila]